MTYCSKIYRFLPIIFYTEFCWKYKFNAILSHCWYSAWLKQDTNMNTNYEQFWRKIIEEFSVLQYNTILTMPLRQKDQRWGFVCTYEDSLWNKFHLFWINVQIHIPHECPVLGSMHSIAFTVFVTSCILPEKISCDSYRFNYSTDYGDVNTVKERCYLEKKQKIQK